MSDPAQALSRVLGHGSAHEGAHHWRVQRLTALALLMLVPWLLVSLALLPDLSWPTVHAWVSGLWHAALLVVLVLCACWHSQLGVQVVIEDYEDLRTLRDERASAHAEPTRSLNDVIKDIHD